MIYLVVKCPYCGRLQIFTPKTTKYTNWKKRCVYCNKSFSVNPKSKYSSSIIIKHFEDIKSAQEFMKLYLKKDNKVF